MSTASASGAGADDGLSISQASGIAPRSIRPDSNAESDLELGQMPRRVVPQIDDTLPSTPNIAQTIHPTDIVSDGDQAISKSERIVWSPRGLANGFPRTAAFFATDPDKTATVFKRFDELSARNLLILQGRVAALEAEQKRQDRKDYLKTSSKEPSYAVISRWLSYEGFSLCAKDDTSDGIPPRLKKKWRIEKKRAIERHRIEPRVRGTEAVYDTNERTEEDNERWELAIAIRSAIKEYHEALLLHSKVLKLEKPARRTRDVVRGWIFGDGDRRAEAEAGAAPQVEYSGVHVYLNDNDLVSLHPPADEDRVSKFASRHMAWLLKDRFNSDAQVTWVPENRVNWFTTIWGAFIALGFLLGAIWSLWHTTDLEKKLGTVTGFVSGWLLVVGFLTRATRSEVFASTAAYAAVLIIYVARPLSPT